MPPSRRSSKPSGERGIRLTEKSAARRRRFCSLKLRMVLVLLAGMLAAYLTYSVVDEVGYQLISRVYMSQTAQKQREQAMAQRLTEYVRENEVSSRDPAALSSWCRQVGYVYLSVYRDGQEVLGTDGSFSTGTGVESYTDNALVEQAQLKNYIAASNTYNGTLRTEEIAGADSFAAGADDSAGLELQEGSVGAQTPEMLLDAEWYGTLYTIPFADGDALVGLVEYSETRYYTILTSVAVASAIAVLLGAVLLFTASLTRRVTAMSRMAARVADGELEAPITVRGADELSSLAADVDRMRSTIVERLHSEQAAWQANNQLITAISHDIRNPLTSLIGYADLLASGQEQDPARQRQYLSACREKAYQLKTLTDELFGYFVVFGSPSLKVEAERLDLCILLEQLLGEAVFQLQAAEFTVEYTPLADPGPLNAELDVTLLKRMLDNLFSNIAKYADAARPVTVKAERTDTGVRITLCNAVAIRRARTESNSIGLRTCRRIAQELGLTFACRSEKDVQGERFAAEVGIPVEK